MDDEAAARPFGRRIRLLVEVNHLRLPSSTVFYVKSDARLDLMHTLTSRSSRVNVQHIL